MDENKHSKLNYRQVDFDQSVNVSKENTLLEFLKYCSAVFLLLFFGYGLLSISVDFIVQRISPSQEEWLWSKIAIKSGLLSDASSEKYSEEIKYLQGLVEKIPKDILNYSFLPRVEVLEDKELNAFAFPGGRIFITSALLEGLPSENGLMFVLGHEVGHFMSRDHLRQLGKGLTLLAVSSLLFGQESSFNSSIAELVLPVKNKFDQKQEIVSDQWGLKIQNSIYGHVGGSNEFFDIILGSRSESRIFNSFETHPLTQDRIDLLSKIVEEVGYSKNQVTPNPFFKPK